MKVKTYDYGDVEIEIRDVINKQYLGKPHRNVIIFDNVEKKKWSYYLLNPKDNGGDLIIYDSIGQENDSQDIHKKAGQIYDSLMEKLEIISDIDNYLEDIDNFEEPYIIPLNSYDNISIAYESGELDQLLLDRGVKIINDDGYGNFELALVGDSVIELDTYTKYLLTGFYF